MLATKDTAAEKTEKIQGCIHLGNIAPYVVGQPDINRAELPFWLGKKTDWLTFILWEESAASEKNKYLEQFKSGIETQETSKTSCKIYGPGVYQSKPLLPFNIKREYTSAVSNLRPEREGFSIGCQSTVVSEPINLPETIESRLKRIAELPENWDSYSASRINSKAIEKSKALLIEAEMRYGVNVLHNAFLAPCSDGGIQLEFTTESEKELIVKISPNGKKVGFLLSEPSGKEKEGTITGLDDWDVVFDMLCKKRKSLR